MNCSQTPRPETTAGSKLHCLELISLKQVCLGKNQGVSLHLSAMKDQRFSESILSLAHLYLEA